MKRALTGYLLLGILHLATLLFAQTDQKLATVRQQLNRIQEEIERLQKELQQSEKQLQSEVQISRILDQQITLVHQSIALLDKEIQKTEKIITQLSHQIDSLDRQIQHLQEIFARQVRFAYKYHRGNMLAWIMGAQSFHQAYVRIRYFQRIARSAGHVYQRIVAKKAERARLRRKYQQEKERKLQMSREKQQEEVRLQEKLQLRQKNIEKIRRNRKLLAQMLEEKKQSYKKLQQIIAKLEKERPQRKLAPHTEERWKKISGSFARQKGKLNWPVQGKILHPFGKYRNPRLKTTIINTGIDIKAPKGTPVRCVFPGVVVMITHMGGFGNTIFVDHNDGYYTVYAHLDEIFVQKMQFLEAGQTIGTVGESGSLEGPVLHFELYENFKPQNPLRWLK